MKMTMNKYQERVMRLFISASGSSNVQTNATTQNWRVRKHKIVSNAIEKKNGNPNSLYLTKRANSEHN